MVDLSLICNLGYQSEPLGCSNVWRCAGRQGADLLNTFMPTRNPPRFPLGQIYQYGNEPPLTFIKID